MLNIRFPDTNVVQCVFSLRSSNTAGESSKFDQYGIAHETRRLKRYSYRVPKYLEGRLAVGEYVLVYCQTGYQVCQVVSVNATCPYDPAELAPVVAKIALEPYFEDLKRQEELKSMKVALIKERKRLEEQVTWDLIAEKHPEFKEMLRAFRDLGGEL